MRNLRNVAEATLNRRRFAVLRKAGTPMTASDRPSGPRVQPPDLAVPAESPGSQLPSIISVPPLGDSSRIKLADVFRIASVSMILTACAHNPSAPTVAPPRPPPEVCAQPPAEPVLPDAAGLVAPVTDDERAAQEAFLRWDSQTLDWGRALAHRSAAWVAFCGG